MLCVSQQTLFFSCSAVYGFQLLTVLIEFNIHAGILYFRNHLPVLVGGRLCALFSEHAEVRRGRLDGTAEHTMYRGILELEESILRWEEDGKGSSEPLSTDPILKKMAELHFPGSLRYQQFKEKTMLEKTLKFILDISRLLRLKRTGWVNCQVREPETVAAHMYRMGIMGLIFNHAEERKSGQLEVDASIIGICHDMAECIIGDITPHCKVSYFYFLWSLNIFFYKLPLIRTLLERQERELQKMFKLETVGS